MKTYSKSKYHNKAVTVDNIRFASLKEANRYKELLLLVKAGKIKNLRLQVPYELVPAQYEIVHRVSEKTGRPLQDKLVCLERSCNYIADFTYEDEQGNVVVEDTKGLRTSDYVIKRKLMLHVHGIRIHEV